MYMHARIHIALFAAISPVLIVPYFEDRSKREFNPRPRFIVFRSNWINGGETAPKKTRERARRRSETAEQLRELGLGVLLRLPRNDTYFCREDSQSQSSGLPHKCLAFV